MRPAPMIETRAFSFAILRGRETSRRRLFEWLFMLVPV